MILQRTIDPRGDAATAAPTLVKDAAWLGFLSVFVLIHLPLFVPVASPQLLESYSSVYLEMFLLPVVAVMLLLGRRRAEHRAERLFWSYLACAILCWWIVHGIYIWIPRDQRGIEAHLAVDGIYLLFYLFFLLAIETRPHRWQAGAPGGPAHRLDTLGLGVLVLALSLYFILIPSHFAPESYATWETSLVLYLTFDILLAVRFVQLAWAWRTTRWRLPYAFLAATSMLWGILDLLELFWRRGAGWLDAPWVDATWQLPFVTLVLASRLRFRERPARDSRVAESLPTPALFRAGSPLTLAVLILPAIHLVLSLSGLVDAQTRTPREAVVFLGLLALGGLTQVERARAQRKSLHQNTHLASLIESTPLPVVLLDPVHRAITCNPAFEALFLYSRAEIVGQDIDPLIAGGESLENARDITCRVLKGESTYNVARRRRSDGSLVDVRIFGVPLKSEGRLIGVFAIYQDLTKRLLAEKTLKESEERFRLLSEATFEGVLLSEESTIFDANQQAADLFGFSVAEMIGTKLGRRVVPAQKESVRDRSQSGYEKPYEIECFRRDRSKLTLEVQGKTIPYKGRQARVTVLRDVTEQHRLEAQLVQSQKMEAIGRLAAGIAHDFNNLLTVILGRGAILERRLDPGTQPRQWVEEINGAAERAAKMTRQLLTFGRKQPLRTEVVSLNRVVSGMEVVLRRLIREDVALVLTLAPGTLDVLADPSQLEQVILNLALNARDAMPEGGELAIGTAGVEINGAGDRRRLDVAPGSYACLTVEDTGTGMDAEVVARAFEPFFTTKEKGGGTGLGLATVHGIVKQSGGGIKVDSIVGRGTTFEVYLPIDAGRS